MPTATCPHSDPGKKYRAVSTILNGFPAKNNVIVDYFHCVIYSISGTRAGTMPFHSNNSYPCSDGRRKTISMENFLEQAYPHQKKNRKTETISIKKTGPGDDQSCLKKERPDTAG
jgi:hypothetical protein